MNVNDSNVFQTNSKVATRSGSDTPSTKARFLCFDQIVSCVKEKKKTIAKNVR